MLRNLCFTHVDRGRVFDGSAILKIFGVALDTISGCSPSNTYDGMRHCSVREENNVQPDDV